MNEVFEGGEVWGFTNDTGAFREDAVDGLGLDAVKSEVEQPLAGFAVVRGQI